MYCSSGEIKIWLKLERVTVAAMTTSDLAMDTNTVRERVWSRKLSDSGSGIGIIVEHSGVLDFEPFHFGPVTR